MNELEYPNYISPLDYGIENPLPVISIGEAKTAEYYSQEQDKNTY